MAKIWKAKTWGSAAKSKGSEGEASGENSPAFVAESEGMVDDDGVDDDCGGEGEEEEEVSCDGCELVSTIDIHFHLFTRPQPPFPSNLLSLFSLFTYTQLPPCLSHTPSTHTSC